MKNDDYHRQLEQWLKQHTKDTISKEVYPKQKYLPPSKGQFKPQPKSTFSSGAFTDADYEINLHNFTIDEAMAKVDYEIKALSKAGYKKLYIIHGKSSFGLNTIGGQLHQHLKSRWNKWVTSYHQSPFNQGSTIVILKGKE